VLFSICCTWNFDSLLSIRSFSLFISAIVCTLEMIISITFIPFMKETKRIFYLLCSIYYEIQVKYYCLSNDLQGSSFYFFLLPRPKVLGIVPLGSNYSQTTNIARCIFPRILGVEWIKHPSANALVVDSDRFCCHVFINGPLLSLLVHPLFFQTRDTCKPTTSCITPLLSIDQMLSTNTHKKLLTFTCSFLIHQCAPFQDSPVRLTQQWSSFTNLITSLPNI